METDSGTPQRVGDIAVDFRLELVGGGSRNLADLLVEKRGAVVVFWSGICSHCVRYDAYLNGFDSRHPDLALALVASRQGETPEQIRRTVAERRLSPPILLDEGSVVARRWSTQQTPRAFLVDGAHTVLYRGAIDNYKYPEDPEYVAYLEPAIEDFLAGRPIARKETASFGCAIQSVYYILPKVL